jgi:import receptor subunit TOM70
MNFNFVAIEDCSEALKRDPLYIKALNRRAISHEIIGKSQLALNDFSALCVLEEFKNQATITNADRVLKNVGETLARAQMSNKKEYLPSASFVFLDFIILI